MGEGELSEEDHEQTSSQAHRRVVSGINECNGCYGDNAEDFSLSRRPNHVMYVHAHGRSIMENHRKATRRSMTCQRTVLTCSHLQDH